jgi:GntR family transcriptional regulator
MIKLEQESIVPLYVQLKEIIKNDVATAKIKPGQKLPTEFELCEMYSISRSTVRAAITELIDEGLLSTKQGKGTFVNVQKIEREIGPTLGFSAICKLNNLTASSNVIEQKLVKANKTLAAQLDVPLHSDLVSIKRVMMADDVPVMLDYSIFPSKYLSLLNEELTNNSLYAILNDKYNVTLSNSRKTIQIIFADATQANYLKIKKGYPLMLQQGVVYSSASEAVHLGEQLIIGDKFKLHI